MPGDMRQIDMAHEAERSEAVHRYSILDTGPEEAFDRIARLAKLALRASAVLVSLIDTDRQWVKSAQGLDVQEVPLPHSLCHQVILQGFPLVVQDCSADDRFNDNPFVTGEPNIRFYMGVPLRTHDGHDIGTVCAIDGEPRQPSADQLSVMQDIAHMVMDELELRRLASIDSLTGAATRRVFSQQASQAMSRAQTHGTPLSVIAIDVDHFKRVNDQHGHAAGDVVLRRLVECCRPSLRSSDLLGRLGGEEFAILLPDTPGPAAYAIAERLRSAIGSMEIPVPSGVIHVTASLGVATSRWRQPFETLLNAADSALYSAKISGRNLTVIA